MRQCPPRLCTGDGFWRLGLCQMCRMFGGTFPLTLSSKNPNFYFDMTGQHHLIHRRFEFGAAIFIAWGGSLLDVLGGAMLAASCPRKKQVSKYPSKAGSRSGPPSSTKEYVWECPLLDKADKEVPPLLPPFFLPSQQRVKLKVHRKLWLIEAMIYWNGTFVFFLSRQDFDNPLIIVNDVSHPVHTFHNCLHMILTNTL